MWFIFAEISDKGYFHDILRVLENFSVIWRKNLVHSVHSGSKKQREKLCSKLEVEH